MHDDVDATLSPHDFMYDDNVIPSDDCSSPTLSHNNISLSSLPSPPISHSAISLEKVTSFYDDDLEVIYRLFK